MDTLGVVGTDYIFVCPVRNAAMYLSTNSDFPVYTYQFQHVSSFNPYGNGYDYCADQVCHGNYFILNIYIYMFIFINFLKSIITFNCVYINNNFILFYLFFFFH